MTTLQLQYEERTLCTLRSRVHNKEEHNKRRNVCRFLFSLCCSCTIVLFNYSVFVSNFISSFILLCLCASLLQMLVRIKCFLGKKYQEQQNDENKAEEADEKERTKEKYARKNIYKFSQSVNAKRLRWKIRKKS